MTMLRGVLDANMVIGLVKGGVFDLLSSLYAPLYIPTGVRQEVLTGQGRPGEAELAQALQAWITEVSPDLGRVPRVSASLSSADREVLAVAADPAMSATRSREKQCPLAELSAPNPRVLCCRAAGLRLVS